MRQKIVIQLGIFCCLIYPLETAITLTTISSLPTRGNFPCGETVTLMCEAPSYSGFLTWEVNLVSMAQCVSGTCSTNPPLPANYNFVFDTTNRIFNFTISPVVIGDNGTEFKCDDTSSSSSFTSLVKVVPTSSGVVYTNTSTANGVDIVLTTGCAYPADVDITWYYKKNITGASRELYTKTSPVTVTDVACQSGNCGLATASKKRSTVRIETSNTGGNQYIFEAFIKHPDASGYYFPVGTYTLADSPGQTDSKQSQAAAIGGGVGGGVGGAVVISVVVAIVIWMRRSGGKFTFSANNYPVLKSAEFLSVDVLFHRCRRSTDRGVVSVECETRDGSAKAGKDFKHTSGQLEFQNNEDRKTIKIPIVNHSHCENDVTFYIELKNPSGRASLGKPHVAVVSIVHDDGHHPGGGDGHTRGKPDGRSNTPVVKDKRHEAVPLDERRQHHDETEKRVRAQPLPPMGASAQDRQETGSAGAVSRQDVHLERRPMPSIPSEKHSRGLSANFEDGDPHKLPNVSIDLPQAGRPKNKLDPIEQTVDEEPETKKKKKKKKKERNMDNVDF